MSTIDPSTIDPTKPAEGNALTANVRANEAATQNNFTAAKTDIEALEAGTGIADGSLTRAKEADMPADTVRMRVATTGVPTDTKLDALSDGGTPSAGDSVLGQKSGGQIVRFDGANLGGGGGGSGDMLAPTAAVAVGELYASTTTTGEQTRGTGIVDSKVFHADAAVSPGTGTPEQYKWFLADSTDARTVLGTEAARDTLGVAFSTYGTSEQVFQEGQGIRASSASLTIDGASDAWITMQDRAFNSAWQVRAADRNWSLRKVTPATFTPNAEGTGGTWSGFGSAEWSLLIDESDGVLTNPGFPELWGNRVLGSLRPETIGDANGFAGTGLAVDTATIPANTYTPAPTGGQLIQFTGATATTIGAMTEQGGVSIIVPSAVTVDLAAYEMNGATQPAGRAGLLTVMNIGGNLFGAWV